jgi:hypothetical protein
VAESSGGRRCLTALKEKNMGLSLEVGLLARVAEDDPEYARLTRDSFAVVNEVLREHGLPAHVEPEVLPDLELLNRAPLRGYPYDFLHRLRRVAAHARARPNWRATPFPESERATKDPLLVAEYERDDLRSHLLAHSDAEGYYVPIDFPEVLVDQRLPGAYLESSQRLYRELVELAPVLGIPAFQGQLPDAQIASISRLIESEGPLWIEVAVWIDLLEAARLSMEHRAAIGFT